MTSQLIGALAVFSTLFLVWAPVPTLAQSLEPWLTEALELQEDIDLDAPISQALWLATHNSFNARGDGEVGVYPDPNQFLSVTEQLEKGVRVVGFDVHALKGPLGTSLVLCHTALPNHLGCSNFERTFRQGLRDIRDWLQVHPDDVIMLKIEPFLVDPFLPGANPLSCNAIDGNYSQFADQIEGILGPYLFKPLQTGVCQFFDQTLSKADILAACKNVFVIANECSETDNAAYQDIVFGGVIRGDPTAKNEKFVKAKDLLECQEYTDVDRAVNMIITQDSRTAGNFGAGEWIMTPDTIVDFLNCGLNIFEMFWYAAEWPPDSSFDSIPSVDFDPPAHDADAIRELLVWSWDEQFPDDSGACANLDVTQDRFRDVPCNSSLPFACRKVRERNECIGRTCSGGANDSLACTAQEDCNSPCIGTGTCDGGCNDNEVCSVQSDCPEGTCEGLTCESGEEAGESCKSFEDCPDGTCLGTCDSGEPAGSCESFEDCTPPCVGPGTCDNDDTECSVQEDCIVPCNGAGTCDGGSNDTEVCSMQSDCPEGTCEGLTCESGEKAGESCDSSDDCPDGTCEELTCDSGERAGESCLSFEDCTDYNVWYITTATGPFADGEQACLDEKNDEFVFAVPRSKYELNALIQVRDDPSPGGHVWVNYAKRLDDGSISDGGTWTADIGIPPEPIIGTTFDCLFQTVNQSMWGAGNTAGPTNELILLETTGWPHTDDDVGSFTTIDIDSICFSESVTDTACQVVCDTVKGTCKAGCDTAKIACLASKFCLSCGQSNSCQKCCKDKNDCEDTCNSVFDSCFNGCTSVLTTCLNPPSGTLGAKVTVETAGEIGLDLNLVHLDAGNVDVNYPVQLTLVTPDDRTYRPGDLVTIDSSCLPQCGVIDTTSPGGEMTLDGRFLFTASVQAEVCVGACTSDTVFDVDISNGNGQPREDELLSMVSTTQNTVTGGGLVADFGLPNVVTTTSVEGKSLVAKGSHKFVKVVFDVDSYLNLPTPQLSVSGLELAVDEFIAIDLVFDLTQDQTFRFDPTVEVELQLSESVNYTIRFAGGGSSSGTSSLITFDIGDSLDFTMPPAILNVAPTFSIKNEDNFSNETTMTYSTEIEFQILTLTVTIPEIDDFAGPLCIPGTSICTAGITFPEIPSATLGPLFETIVPVNSITDTSAFDGDTPPWSLEGFAPHIGAPLDMEPELPPVAVIDAPTTATEGDILAFSASNSTDANNDPLTFSWDFGDGHTATGENVNHAYADNGTYTVTLGADDGNHPSPSETTQDIVVSNVTPSVDAGLAQNPDEGVVILLDPATFSDPGFDDAVAGGTEDFSATVAWGDGNVEPVGNITLVETPGSEGVDTTGTVAASHAYADNGTYTVAVCVTDDDSATDCDTMLVTVANVAPQILSATPASQTHQYSDVIDDISISARDVAADSLTASSSHTVDGGGSIPGLPAGLSLSSDGCAVSGLFHDCDWTISGTIGEPAGTYDITVEIEDDDGAVSGTTVTLVVEPEDATVAFDSGNPVAMQVATDGGNSGPFSLSVDVQELFPDLAAGTALPGDIGLAVMSMTLAPVGPGGSAVGTCTPDNDPNPLDYSGVLTVTCTFDDVSVNTYTVEAVLVANGGGELFYAGSNEDVLVVFDPSLGFTTGGGHIDWPGTGDRTTWGFTMKYNKKQTHIQGSLLLIRHLPDGSIYRIKSNSLFGLAIGDGENNGPFGWATFAGKCTYRDPSMDEPEGNHEFVTYVEDHGEPGAGVDRFWLQTFDKDGVLIGDLSMAETAPDNAETIVGGNIVVPH